MILQNYCLKCHKESSDKDFKLKADGTPITTEIEREDVLRMILDYAVDGTEMPKGKSAKVRFKRALGPETLRAWLKAEGIE